MFDLEAKKSHWDGVYHPGWEVGTGWMTPEQRQVVWDNRKQLEGN